MSDSSNDRRRVGEVQAAQRALQTRRFQLERATAPIDRVDADASWPDRSAAWDAASGAVLRDALRRVTADPSPARAGVGEPALPITRVPLAVPPPMWAAMETPTQATDLPMMPPVTSAPPRENGERAAPAAEWPAEQPVPPAPAPLSPRPMPGLWRASQPRRTGADAAIAAFDAGIRETLPMPTRREAVRQEAGEPADLDLLAAWHERPEPVPAASVPEAVPAPVRSAKSSPTSSPQPAPPPPTPQPAVPVQRQASLAFEAGLREAASLPPVSLSLPIARPAERPVPVARASDAEAVQMPLPIDARAPMPPRPTAQGEAPAAADAAHAFALGARQGAALAARPPAPPPPADAAPSIESDMSEAQPSQADTEGDDDTPQGPDALQAAQQALDGRLAHLTFRGIVGNGTA